MPPYLPLHPIFNILKTSVGMSHPKVVSPATKFRIDEFYHPVNWLRYEPPKDSLEVTQKVRPRFRPRCDKHSRLAAQCSNPPDVESQKAKALSFYPVNQSCLLGVHCDINSCKLLKKPPIYLLCHPVQAVILSTSTTKSSAKRAYSKGKALAIAYPKLDVEQDIYIEKIQSMIEDAKINTLSILTMQVPCCSGLLRLTKTAMKSANRKVPIKSIVVGLQGEVLHEAWL
jgi:hypothetical protein